MALMIDTSPKSKYPPLEEGLYQGVLAEIVDLGEIQGKFDERPFHKLQLVFQLDAIRDDGKRHEVRSHPEKASIHEKSNLRTKFIEKMIGKENAARAIAAAGSQFDIEAALLGVNCQIEVIHNSTGEYANIGSIIAYRGKTPLAVSEDYEPLQSRENYKAPENFFAPLSDDEATQMTGHRAPVAQRAMQPAPTAKIPDNALIMSNKAESPKEYAKKLNKGEETPRLQRPSTSNVPQGVDTDVDDRSVFDEDLSDEERATLLNAPAQPAAYPSN